MCRCSIRRTRGTTCSVWRRAYAMDRSSRVRAIARRRAMLRCHTRQCCECRSRSTRRVGARWCVAIGLHNAPPGAVCRAADGFQSRAGRVPRLVSIRRLGARAFVGVAGCREPRSASPSADRRCRRSIAHRSRRTRTHSADTPCRHSASSTDNSRTSSDDVADAAGGGCPQPASVRLSTE